MKDFFKKIFEGRLNRRNYILGLLVSILPVFAIFFLYFLLKLIEIVFGIVLIGGGFWAWFFVVVGLFVFVYFLIIPLSLVVRRFHDLNYSWVHLLIVNVVLFLLTLTIGNVGKFISFIYGLYLILKVGSKGKNKYGEEDKPRKLKNILGLY